MASMKNTLKLFVVLICIFVNGVFSTNYKEALTKSLLYYEAQRSGILPADQRVNWRGNSALKDGQDAGVDLVGGYYDAGDNVKFGFPMAYTITMLAWSAVEYGSQLKAQNELQNALSGIKWGTDYFIKAHPQPNLFYAQVGEGDSDHQCWERPEDMTTPRTVYKIDEQSPGSDLAAETAAAFAAASIAFKNVDPKYSSLLLTHAKQLFDFATSHQGKYSDSIPAAAKYYSSSGFQDELMWGAAWLYRATNEDSYKQIVGNSQAGGTRTMFSWDDKYVGAQILVAKEILEGKVANSGNWGQHKEQVEEFLCNCVQKGNHNVIKSNGGLLWFDEWNNLQYTVSASFALTVYADYLSTSGQPLKCSSSLVNPSELTAFATSQVEYILGANPQKRSYMVGFGSNYPQKVHHRASSIVSLKMNRAPVGCSDGFTNWFYKDQPNPNILVGAVVGGPDKNDNYVDDRGNYQKAEPSTSTPPGLVGVLARIS
ncbi:endoglucanase 13-like [Silene latifolia]|uniref:endoglucanase 13-like n=1 Tax=Silene latifolia TaxID=37657 RepID=UPI003D772C56